MNIHKRGEQYHLTETEVQKLLEGQSFQCAICKQDLKQGAHFDHSHELGFVRGILCPSCNLAIGLLKDNPGNCVNAADYLLKFSDWSSL